MKIQTQVIKIYGKDFYMRESIAEYVYKLNDKNEAVVNRLRFESEDKIEIINDGIGNSVKYHNTLTDKDFEDFLLKEVTIKNYIGLIEI